MEEESDKMVKEKLVEFTKEKIETIDKITKENESLRKTEEVATKKFNKEIRNRNYFRLTFGIPILAMIVARLFSWFFLDYPTLETDIMPNITPDGKNYTTLTFSSDKKVTFRNESSTDEMFVIKRADAIE